MVLCDTLVSYLETSFLKTSADAPKVGYLQDIDILTA